MGLAIRYNIKAPSTWRPQTVRAKLEQARQFALTLPVAGVSALEEFAGEACDFQHVRDAGLEDQDSFFWAKIQGQRHMFSPWEPGSPRRQAPTHMLIFTVDPADGCDEANFGMCAYPGYVWKAGRDQDSTPAWSVVFDKENENPASRREMRRFMRRWRLKNLPESQSSRSERFGQIAKRVCCVAGGRAEAVLHEGRHHSGRSTSGKAFGMVVIADMMLGEVCFRFQGTAEEAERTFCSTAFHEDLARMVLGQEHRTPPAHGLWEASCQTQYAHDPRRGGWENFVKAHLSVLAVLEEMQCFGFGVHVWDEGGFWGERDLGKLARRLGEQESLVAGVLGLMKDAASKSGSAFTSAMDGRPDFERLEMAAHKGKLGDLLKKITEAGQKPPS